MFKSCVKANVKANVKGKDRVRSCILGVMTGGPSGAALPGPLRG